MSSSLLIRTTLQAKDTTVMTAYAPPQDAFYVIDEAATLIAAQGCLLGGMCGDAAVGVSCMK